MADSLNTAEKMVTYCQAHKLGNGMSTSWDLKHFSLIEDTLLSGERVYLVFEGLHNYQSTTKHDKNFAYAITSKRIILAQKKVIGSVLQTISLQNVNDITFRKKLVMGIITIDTIKETFHVASDYETAGRIFKAIQSVLDFD